MDRKKTLRDYNFEEIYQVLYHSDIPKDLWGNEKRETEQLFINHSVGNLKMFQIPLIWIPIIRKLLLALIKIDPDIHFFQVREQSGELSLLTRPSHTYEPLIRQTLFGAKKAINTVTLIQLRLIDRIKK